MPKEKTKELMTVNIMFESNRLKEIYLTQAYEKLLPITRKIIKKSEADSANGKFSYVNQKEQ